MLPRTGCGGKHMASVTGIGGVFFKTADRDATNAWYRDMLGLELADYGATLPHAAAGSEAYAVFGPFAAAARRRQRLRAGQAPCQSRRWRASPANLLGESGNVLRGGGVVGDKAECVGIRRIAHCFRQPQHRQRAAHSARIDANDSLALHAAELAWDIGEGEMAP